MTKTKTTKFKESHPLTYLVATMYDKRVFDLIKLRRKFSHILSIAVGTDRFNCHDREFSFSNRITKNSCGGHYEFQLDGTVRVSILFSTLYKAERQFHFNVSNNKELLEKLIHYNLIS